MKTSTGTGELPRTNPKHWVGVEADDIPQGWMDDMVRRLFDVLNRDMIRLEAAQIGESDKKDPDGNPLPLDLEHAAKKNRLLNQMQQSLERLTEMEKKRVKARKPKLATSHDESRRKLQRRLDRLVESNAAGEDTAKPDGG
jgi:hypothetical protein